MRYVMIMAILCVLFFTGYLGYNYVKGNEIESGDYLVLAGLILSIIGWYGAKKDNKT